MRKRRIRTTAALLALAAVVVSMGTADADTVMAWGGNAYGESAAPADTDFASVVAGYWHSVALRADGRLAAWGDNLYGQGNVPAGSDFVAVAAGAWHGLALRSNGSVAAWGRNTYGQCNAPTGGGFVAVAAGGYHSLALRTDGVLAAWGRNDYGQCNVPAGRKFVAVAGGERHTVAVADDGTLVAWGRNDYGQCNVPAGNDYVSVAAGAWHSLALKADGALLAWGRNDYGQCNVRAGQTFLAVTAGERHTLGLASDGRLLGWGRNDAGQCNAPAGENYACVAAGWFHSLALAAEPTEPENRAPVAYNQALTTDEDTPLVLVLGAWDEDGDALDYAVATPPVHGTLVGTSPFLTYTPNPDYHGPDEVAFQVADGLLSSNVAIVGITVSPTNDPPVAAARVNGQESVNIVEASWLGTTVTLDAGSSYDPDGDALSFAWDFTGDGTSDVFEPVASFTYAAGGPYVPTVKVTDTAGARSVATVTITVSPGSTANQLENVEGLVLDSVASGQIAPALGPSLTAKLQAVSAALETAGPNAETVAANTLKALLNQVQAQTGKKITADAATELTERINLLIAALAG